MADEVLDSSFSGINDLKTSNKLKSVTNMIIDDPELVGGSFTCMRALHPREIQLVLYVNGKMGYFSVDELTYDTTEQLLKHHGTGKGEGSALIGGEIDHAGSFSLTSYVGDMTKVDLLRGLLRKGSDHRAVYFDVHVNYIDYDGEFGLGGGAHQNAGISSVGTEGDYIPIIALRWCKVKTNGVTVPKGNAVTTKWDFDYLSYLELL
jgi:hypothetical protein